MLAHKAHRTLEVSHAFVYFAPEVAARFSAIGLTHPRSQYFASRAAPFGPVGPAPVTATFYGFSPALVAKSLPAAWQLASPADVLAARFTGVDDVLSPLVGPVVTPEAVSEAAALAREATGVLPSPGRPLYAAHAALDWPEPAHLQLWHALTLLREWRGDGHIAVLVSEGIAAPECLQLHAAFGGPAERVLQQSRGWSAEQWAAARDALVQRGLLDPTGGLTAAGHELRQRIEDRTDELDAAPYRQLGEQRTERLRQLVRPLSARLAPLVAAMAPTRPEA